MKVKELIKQLQKLPQDADVGFYSDNAYNRGEAQWMNYIRSVEVYKGCFFTSKKVVALIGGFN